MSNHPGLLDQRRHAHREVPAPQTRVRGHRGHRHPPALHRCGGARLLGLVSELCALRPRLVRGTSVARTRLHRRRPSLRLGQAHEAPAPWRLSSSLETRRQDAEPERVQGAAETLPHHPHPRGERASTHPTSPKRPARQSGQVRCPQSVGADEEATRPLCCASPNTPMSPSPTIAPSATCAWPRSSRKSQDASAPASTPKPIAESQAICSPWRTRVTTRWWPFRSLSPGVPLITWASLTDKTQPGGPVRRHIEYIAPFTRCDRERDYRIAWEAFDSRIAVM